MAFQIIRCPYCGCEGQLERRGNVWYCAHCANYSTEDGASRAYNALLSGIDAHLGSAVDKAMRERKEAEYYNLRSMLWEKIHEKYTDSKAIVEICREIKKIDPKDFLASFFELSNSASDEETASFINGIDTAENALFIDLVIDFTIRSLRERLILPIGYLIERAYKNTDLKRFEEYSTLLEAEAEKVSSGIYATMNPRDVFIAYSSKDIDKVTELVGLIEENGLSCFVALRNLQHGRGAKANYSAALREAIDNSGCVVFVSSKDSRSFSCDALKEELKYIRDSELASAPPQYKNDYAKLPAIYKKPRIEYRLDNTPSPTDRFVSEFFSGLDYCETPEKVLSRVVDLKLYGADGDIEAESNTEKGGKGTDTRTENASKSEAEIFSENALREASIAAEKLIEDAVNPKARQSEPAPTEDEIAEKSPSEIFIEQYCESGDGVIKKCSYDGDEIAELIIPEYITEIGDGAFKNALWLKRLVISEGTVKIGEEAFSGCASLESITLLDTLTGIGYAAFSECKSLKSAILPDSVEFLDDCVFSECSSLESVSLPKGIGRIGDLLFFSCSSLKSITIPDGVTEIGKSAFYDCSSLSEINIPDSVETIGDSAFSDCTGSEYLTLGKGLRSIGYHAFFMCDMLDQIIIPKSVSKIGDAAFTASSDVIIYCEAKKPLFGKPRGWASDWCGSAKVIWGYSENG